MAKSAALLVLALAAGAMATDISFGECPKTSNAVQNFEASKVGGLVVVEALYGLLAR